MSAGILRALMELFAIIARSSNIGDKNSSSRDVVAMFLRQQLNKELVARFLQVYDELVDSHESQRNLDSERNKKRTSLNSVKILKICIKINEELARKEKVYVLLRLLEFVEANKNSGAQELEFVHTVADTFNIRLSTVSSMETLVRATVSDIITDPEFLYVLGKDAENEENSKVLNVSGLSGRMLLLRIEEDNMFFMRYFGTDNLFLNGQVLSTERSHIFRQGATIRGSRIQPIYYSDIIGCFLTSHEGDGIDFRAANVSYYFKGSRKLALHQFSLNERSGNLVGIMGASGSGKSTMLNILNGNYAPTFGKVTINGVDIHHERNKIEGVIGYVAQDDLLIEELSVFDNLYFNAKLCFANKSDHDITELVENTLSNIGLLETRDLRVGSPLEKTISGGQRKRLNIALELIREPGVLFVDEPTSGLSSRDSENIMDLLKELTLRGKLIFVVIHQPSSDIFKMIDRLFILDQGGYPIYYGNPVESIVYFKRLVNHVNQEECECPNCGNVNPEQLFNIIESRVVDEYGMLTEHRKISPREWNNFYNVMIGNKMGQAPDNMRIPESNFSLPSKINQFKVFLKRDFLSKLSNKQYMLINFLEAPALAVVLAFFVKFYQGGSDSGSEYIFRESENLPQYLFISVIVALFLGLTVSAEEIIRDKKILKREEFLNLSRKSYLLSKIGIMFAISAIQMGMYVFIGNSILDIRGMAVPYWLVLFSTSCFANLLGLNISASFNSAKVIYILIPILIIPQLLFSGVIVKFDKLYPAFASQKGVPLIGNIMASRWAYEALAVNQFRNNDYERQFFGYDKDRKYCNWKKDYWVREMRNRINQSKKYLLNKEADADKLAYNILLLRNELMKEEQSFGNLSIPGLDKMSVTNVNEDFFNLVDEKLDQLFEYYKDRYNAVAKERENYMMTLTSSEAEKQALIQLKDQFKNESLEEFVTNKKELKVIVDYQGELVQKSDPIYLIPRNVSFFESHFYAPVKPLLGQYLSTYSANLLVIWGMTVMMILLLFMDGMRKFLELIGGGWTVIGSHLKPGYKEAEYAS